MVGASADPAASPNIYFQCDASGHSHPRSTPTEARPRRPTAPKSPPTWSTTLGRRMINIYPAPNANMAVPRKLQLRQRACPQPLNETKFDARAGPQLLGQRHRLRPLQLRPGVSYVPGRRTGGSCRGQRLRQQSELINHARNIGPRRNSHLFTHTVNQATFGYDRIFDYIASQGYRHLRICQAWHSRRQPGLLGLGSAASSRGAYSCGLVSVLMSGGYWSLGDRGYSPFQGGTNIFTFKDDSLDLIRGKHEIQGGIDLRATTR